MQKLLQKALTDSPSLQRPLEQLRATQGSEPQGIQEEGPKGHHFRGTRHFHTFRQI